MKAPRSLSLVLLLIGFFCLGATVATAAEPDKKDAKPHSKTLLTTLVEGGWVMFPIAVMSVLTVYLSTEGVKNTSLKKTSPP